MKSSDEPSGFDGRVVAVVPAAGSGTRLGFEQPKAFVSLAGRTLLERSVDALHDSACVQHVQVVVSQDMRADAEELLYSSVNERAWRGMRIGITLGGAERMDSVLAGLLALEAEYVPPIFPDCSGIAEGTGCAVLSDDSADSEEYGEPEYAGSAAPAGDFPPADRATRASNAGSAARTSPLVLVHDAARPLTPPELIAELVSEAARAVSTGEASGVVPVLPVSDTIKVVDIRKPQDIRLEQTPARETLRAAQTPQIFSLRDLIDANNKYAATVEMVASHASALAGNAPLQAATDDASLLEMAGYRVRACPGDERAMKITTARDFAIAELMVKGEL